jgi:hypothetical protein
VDQLPGSSSDAHVVQHWATVSGGNVGVVWSSRDAPVVCFGGLWPGYVSQAHHAVPPPGFGHPFLRPGDLRCGHLYSYVMNNNFRTNFQAVQVADVLFRYSFTSYRPEGAHRRPRDFGWGVGNPLETVGVRGPQASPLPPREQLCRVEGDAVVLLTLKRAEDGRGVILRVIETAGCEGGVRVHLPFYPVSYAVETNLVEEDQRMLPVDGRALSIPLRPHGITTVRCVAETTIPPG